MSERLRPATTGGIPSKFEAKVMEPPVKSGSGRGSDTGIPGTGTSFTPDRQPQPNKSHKIRNWIMAATATLGGGAGAFIATRGGNEASPTSTAVVTTVDVKPTSPSDPVTTTVGESSTTVRETTTTQEPKPTDVIEHRDGYDVLQNGGYLYEVASAPWAGGIELHLESKGVRFEFQKPANGDSAPQETVFNSILWAFATQKGMTVESYIQYLQEHNWVDEEAYFPKNIAENSTETMPPVVKSEPQRIDFSKPIIFTNDNPFSIDGLDATGLNTYVPGLETNIREVFGSNPDGQLVYGGFQLSSNGTPGPISIGGNDPIYLSYEFGSMLTITGQITNQMTDPKAQWVEPRRYYYDPYMVNTSNLTPPYPILNVLDFVNYNRAIDPNKATEKLFAPTS